MKSEKAFKFDRLKKKGYLCSYPYFYSVIVIFTLIFLNYAILLLLFTNQHGQKRIDRAKITLICE